MKTQTYEQAMERLNEITNALENSTLPLEDSLKLYTEASTLVSFCNKCLDTAEQKIIDLSKEEGAVDA